MSDAVKETPCSRCIHREVCKYMKDVLKTIKTIEKATVYQEEIGSIKLAEVINDNCFCDITVTCHYYLPAATTPR